MGRLTYEREFVRPEGIFRKESNGKSIIKIIMTKRTDVKDDPEDQAYYVQDWVQVQLRSVRLEEYFLTFE